MVRPNLNKVSVEGIRQSDDHPLVYNNSCFGNSIL
jgi:hypothetical protein